MCDGIIACQGESPDELLDNIFEASNGVSAVLWLFRLKWTY